MRPSRRSGGVVAYFHTMLKVDLFLFDIPAIFKVKSVKNRYCEFVASFGTICLIFRTDGLKPSTFKPFYCFARLSSNPFGYHHSTISSHFRMFA